MVDINLPILLVQVLTFLVALGILWKLLWGPFVSFMEKRAQAIENDINTAKKSRAEAESKDKEYQVKLLKIQEEAKLLLDKARNEGEKQKEDIINSSREETKTMLSNAKKDILLEKNNSLKALKDDIISLSASFAEKILKQPVDNKLEDKLYDEFINNLKND